MNEGVLLEQDMGEHDLLLENQKKVEQGQQTNFAIAYKKSQQKKTIKTEIKKVPLSFSFSFSFSFPPFSSLPFPYPLPLSLISLPSHSLPVLPLPRDCQYIRNSSRAHSSILPTSSIPAKHLLHSLK